MKSLLLNLRNLPSQSHQGNKDGEIKALETRPVYKQNNWSAAANALMDC